jgi:hypothetical protein
LLLSATVWGGGTEAEAKSCEGGLIVGTELVKCNDTPSFAGVGMTTTAMCKLGNDRDETPGQVVIDAGKPIKVLIKNPSQDMSSMIAIGIHKDTQCAEGELFHKTSTLQGKNVCTHDVPEAADKDFNAYVANSKQWRIKMVKAVPDDDSPDFKAAFKAVGIPVTYGFAGLASHEFTRGGENAEHKDFFFTIAAAAKTATDLRHIEDIVAKALNTTPVDGYTITDVGIGDAVPAPELKQCSIVGVWKGELGGVAAAVEYTADGKLLFVQPEQASTITYTTDVSSANVILLTIQDPVSTEPTVSDRNLLMLCFSFC